jgi:hypothetical protein
VIVRVVDIGGIVDHHRLHFLFIKFQNRFLQLVRFQTKTDNSFLNLEHIKTNAYVETTRCASTDILDSKTLKLGSFDIEYRFVLTLWIYLAL